MAEHDLPERAARELDLAMREMSLAIQGLSLALERFAFEAEPWIDELREPIVLTDELTEYDRLLLEAMKITNPI